MSETRWMAFSSANWLDSPLPSAVSLTCHGGTLNNCLQPLMLSYSTAGPMKAHCFSFPGNLLHSGASSAEVTVLRWHFQFFASWPDRPLPGFLEIIIWAYGLISATQFMQHQLHDLYRRPSSWIISTALAAEVSGRDVLQVPITSEAAQTFL